MLEKVRPERPFRLGLVQVKNDLTHGFSLALVKGDHAPHLHTVLFELQLLTVYQNVGIRRSLERQNNVTRYDSLVAIFRWMSERWVELSTTTAPAGQPRADAVFDCAQSIRRHRATVRTPVCRRQTVELQWLAEFISGGSVEAVHCGAADPLPA
jgi:hypothetical protein